MSVSDKFSSALLKSKNLGEKTFLRNRQTTDTVAYENLSLPVMELFIDRYGQDALDYIWEQEKRKILRWMYGGE